MKTIALYLYIFAIRKLALFAEWFVIGWQKLSAEMLDWVQAFHASAMPTKVLAYTSLVAITTGLQAILKELQFNDWSFVAGLFLLVVIDTLLALVYHIHKGTVSSKGWGKAGTKLLVYLGLILATHLVTIIKIDGASNVITEWINNVVYSFLLVRELISIIEKAGMLGVAVPAWILARLKGFTQEGKIEVPENQPKP